MNITENLTTTMQEGFEFGITYKNFKNDESSTIVETSILVSEKQLKSNDFLIHPIWDNLTWKLVESKYGDQVVLFDDKRGNTHLFSRSGYGYYTYLTPFSEFIKEN